MNDKPNQLVVIDDDAAICAIVRRNLKETVWEVASFDNELEGMEYLASHQPNVLLVDIRMPRIDGDQILEELTAANRLFPRTRVLVTSSVPPPSSIWRNFEKFAARFILKDVVVSKTDLLALINSPSEQSSLFPESVVRGRLEAADQ